MKCKFQLSLKLKTHIAKFYEENKASTKQLVQAESQQMYGILKNKVKRKSEWLNNEQSIFKEEAKTSQKLGHICDNIKTGFRKPGLEICPY